MTATELRDRITAYLSAGGLFNPELANQEAVRDLLIDCRDFLSQPELTMSAEEVRRPGKYRLVYNKTTRKIDKVRNYDGLAVESFDPPIECDDLSRKEKA